MRVIPHLYTHMEKETRSKIMAVDHAMKEELEKLFTDLEYRVGRITKLKEKIMELIKK